MRALLFLAAFALVCAGCGSNGGLNLPSSPGKFTVDVLPESFALGGDAANVTVAASYQEHGISVDVAGTASDLKAFYFDLNYDPALWHPTAVEQLLGQGQGPSSSR
jgi:hypothetical protein